jgi:hypothetical protein
MEPFHFKVAGLPAVGRMSGIQRWRVPLGPELLPQLVEVLFQGKLTQSPRAGGEMLFAAPTIAGIPVSHTLWTVQGPSSMSGEPILGHITASQEHLEQQRKQTAEALLRQGLADASQANPSDRDAWRKIWDAHIAQIDGRLRQPALGVSRPAIGSEAGIPTDLACQWIEQSADDGPIVHCSLRGESARLSMQFPHLTRRWLLTRAAYLTVLIVVVISGTWLTQRVWLREFWSRSPQLVIAVLGLGWWLFCAPSVIGLIVLIAGAASALRPHWRTLPA